MHPFLIGFLVILSVYLISLIWANLYWSKYLNRKNIKLCQEELSLIRLMLFGWFFFWDGIKIIIKNADRTSCEK